MMYIYEWYSPHHFISVYYKNGKKREGICCDVLCACPAQCFHQNDTSPLYALYWQCTLNNGANSAAVILFDR